MSESGPPPGEPPAPPPKKPKRLDPRRKTVPLSELPPEVVAQLVRPVGKKKGRGRPFTKDDPRRNTKGRPPGPPPPPGFRAAVTFLADEATQVVNERMASGDERVSLRAAVAVLEMNLKLLLAKLGADGAAGGLPMPVDLSLATDEELKQFAALREQVDGLFTLLAARKSSKQGSPGAGDATQGAGTPAAG